MIFQNHFRDHKKYDDLAEVAKLFNLHQKLDEEEETPAPAAAPEPESQKAEN
jgi:hypothetical protein